MLYIKLSVTIIYNAMHQFDLSFSIFPQTRPNYEPIKDDPIFDPVKHLALEAPTQTYTLRDFGYGNEVKGTTPTEVFQI